jgi:hypothetical protein
VHGQDGSHVGDGERLHLRQPVGQCRADDVRVVVVVDVVHDDRRTALPHHVGDRVDQRGMRLRSRANPLGENQSAVDVEMKQRFERQCGPQPGRGGADAAAAAEVVETVHHDERVAPGNR